MHRQLSEELEGLLGAREHGFGFLGRKEGKCLDLFTGSRVHGGKSGRGHLLSLSKPLVLSRLPPMDQAIASRGLPR